MNPKILGAVQIILPLIAFIIAIIAEGFSTMTIATALLVLTFIIVGVHHLTEEAAAPAKPAEMAPSAAPPGTMPPPSTPPM